ncbi:hypothetical protein [Arthrobacter sp. QXT-31]|uniref:hypothetical protein n=1 Tax=Arthrobacter sp. QXT-31 TaxID=1357915 RepID=UPI0012F88011|nr:hypothetical protein [Arthrobacter sp. QXT-31]
MAELRLRGIDVQVHELFSDKAFTQKNERGAARIYAAAVLLLRIVSRIFFLFRRCDILVVHREAFPFFTPLMERLAAKRSQVTILDIDDAIHAAPTHIRDWRRLLRQPVRALEFASIFDLILCGNESLVETYGSGKATAVYQPTCPPSSTFEIEHQPGAPITLLWTGSQSTLGSLQTVLTEVLEVCDEEQIFLDVLGGTNIEDLPAHPRLRARRWSNQTEAELLRSASIGLMPLPDTEWERGKSGYKAILYLCAGMKAVVSPVGINSQLADDYESISACDAERWSHEIRRAVRSVRENGLSSGSQHEARAHFDTDVNAKSAVDLILEIGRHEKREISSSSIQ